MEEVRSYAMFLGRRLKHWVEDIFLLSVIILNILDFFEILPGDFDFIKKILSWAVLGYLMYHVNLAKIIFGKDSHEDMQGMNLGLKPQDVNLLIIVSYFMMIFKNMVHYADTALTESAAGRMDLSPISKTVLEAFTQIPNIDHLTLVAGGCMLFIVSIVLALKYDIRAPSIMHIIHEEGDPSRSIKEMLLRFISIFLILISFYILVFNFFMEWLAFAVDAPLLVFGIVAYFFVIVRSHKSFHPESFIFKIGNFGEEFYEHFLTLFYTKSGLFLGMTGMLILHLLTDIGNFMLPYTLGFHDSLYFSGMEVASHRPIFFGNGAIFPEILDSAPGAGILVTSFIIYLVSIIGALALFIVPGYLWYKVYISRGINVPHLILGLFYASVLTLLLSRSFQINAINQEGLVGVDITTHHISTVLPGWLILIFAVVLALLVFVLSFNFRVKSILMFIAMVGTLIFVGTYVALFAISTSRNYLFILHKLLELGNGIGYLMFFFLAVFFIIVLIFYVGSFLLYLKEAFTEFKYIQ
ncbi:hypothetical protein H6504_02925 [Candidatus Woesearchaeota archaeon]|nr:hypothetical protein [Candidatus Woesearchaeota archaeon]